MTSLQLAGCKIHLDGRFYGNGSGDLIGAPREILCHKGNFIILLAGKIIINKLVGDGIGIKSGGIITVAEVPSEYGGMNG